MNQLLTDIKKLSVSERIILVEEIWNSILPLKIDIPEEDREEFYNRYAAHQADPTTGIPWSELRAKLFLETQD